MPKNARWDVISEAAHKEEIGLVIDDAMRAIEMGVFMTHAVVLAVCLCSLHSLLKAIAVI